MKWLKGIDTYGKPHNNKVSMSKPKQKSARVILENNSQLRPFLQPNRQIKPASFQDKFCRWRRQGKIPMHLLPTPPTPEVKMPWSGDIKLRSRRPPPYIVKEVLDERKPTSLFTKDKTKTSNKSLSSQLLLHSMETLMKDHA